MFALLVVGISLGLFLYWYVTFRQRRRRLYELAEKLPGAAQIPLAGHLHRFLGNTEDNMTSLKEMTFLALHNGGASKIWLGPKLVVLLVDMEDMDFILKNQIDKGSFLPTVFKSYGGNSLLFGSVSIWRPRRKALLPAFSKKNLDLIMEVFSKNSETLVESLKEKSGKGTFDAWTFFATYTLQNIMESGVESLEEEHLDCELIIKAMDEGMAIASSRFLQPWLLIDAIFKMTPSYYKMTKLMDFCYQCIDKVIKANTKNSSAAEKEDMDARKEKKWKTLMGNLLNLPSSEYKYRDFQDDIIIVTVAATDTTALTSCYALMMLSKYPELQEKIFEELDEVFGQSERPPQMDDFTKLVYLERVIKETLRLFPPIPFVVREDKNELTLPSGRVLPAGCTVLLSIWGLHRHSRYWDGDVERFDPDRFLPERFSKIHPHAYIPFSAGPRNCVAYQYAMRAMKVALSSVLRRFQVVPSKEPRTVQIRVQHDITLKPAKGFDIMLKLRGKTQNEE